MHAQTVFSKKTLNTRKIFFQWEWMLVLIFILINIINSLISPYYLNAGNLLNATMTFMDKAFILLPMTFVIILGAIDISVGSIVALSAVIMAVLYNTGVPMPVAMAVCIAVGTLCGFINGILIVKFKELSAMIVTLSTMIIYRGIAYIILEDRAAGKFPAWYTFLGWGYVAGIPFSLIVFAGLAVIFGLVLHKTTFGRRVYAIGNNAVASRYSGIEVDKIKLIIFTVTGTMSAVAALFLSSRMGSVRPNVATGYEMEVIAAVVLGGVSSQGGKGRMIGAVLALFVIGFLRYGLGLINISSQVLLIIIGLLLVFAVLIPNVRSKLKIKVRR
ncbi:ribose transport system permease protein RbsC [Thermoclostridium stercorarium subsp. stercorarium DSM 8532]|jgi:rhamnose transport system permease protein|uniref:Autoinducer 2 import system permease protein LsrD n=3 Tax=Thermoclostridium stercorarium TaxID=1510 RepID=L7VLI7_THES1|nr:ABC transporter permease [Thermoclostridium stercorarium]AGC67504.1 ribose transport system permease protein RbsC [Thermoclostridium stercorarium subsp. stercorarium DSM 8532]AGI38559.1 ABC transporter periplasmic subunit [Thermoclostridium stercorarium subsp. stercorarium DSM 8532]ANW97931.1 branched-chain amino acid ABC transporter permease [Thermoclostridium stercorarium subsp. thermolacticum DSM 2910]ANX00481.1 branched-chain amino acid ABC transporter permease [Thermoclostridium stercor